MNELNWSIIICILVLKMYGLCIKSKKRGSKIDRSLKNIGFSAFVLHKIINHSLNAKGKETKKNKKTSIRLPRPKKINRSMVPFGESLQIIVIVVTYDFKSVSELKNS